MAVIMRSKDRLLELAALFVILMLAAYLRLANLAANPGWYTDEGTHLDLARNLITGRVQYLAIDESVLLFSRLPLFEALFALWTRVFGLSLEALRALTGTLGVASVAVLYAAIRAVSRDRVLAVLAAFLLAIYPSAVLYSRFGFSYNLLAPLLLIAVWGLIEYRTVRPATPSKRWLAVSAFSIGLGAITEVWAWGLIGPFVLIVATRNWRDLLWSVPLALLPPGLYALSLLFSAPHAFLFDLRFVLSRLNQLSIPQQVETLWQNISTLSAQDSWMWIGTLGLGALRPVRARWVVLAFAVIPFALLGRTTALFSLSYYYLIPLLPLVALGVASALRFGVGWLIEWVGRGMNSSADTQSRLKADWRTVLAVGLSGLIGLATVPPVLEQVTTHFQTDIDPFLIEANSAQAAAAFVNAQVKGDDLVIASPAVAWPIQSNVADFQMSIAYSGQATPHLPANVPAERWAFDPRYSQARFVIVDNLWRNWAVPNVAGVREMLIDVETWPLALKTGQISVYAKPR